MVDESLPQLNEGRYEHACGSYYSNGTRVNIMILSNLLFYLILKVLVVAGGSYTPKGRHPPQRSSTEILTGDSNSWKVSGQRGFSLPMLHAVASVSTETSLLIFGKK